jgi:hypothetical protein
MCDRKVMTDYFSDQERGPIPRTSETITPAAWGGIVAVVNSAVHDGSFGEDFTAVCPDGSCVCGTDSGAFSLAVQAEVHAINWPLQTDVSDHQAWVSERTPYAPDTLDILDFVQFCHRHISRAVRGRYHGFFSHYHLSFDRERGRSEFRDRVNTVLARNGVAFDLQSDGSIKRLAPPVLAEALRAQLPSTGDSALDGLVESARRKFFSPDPAVRKEALEKLWDAWERLKSLRNPGNKKESVARLLDAASSEATFRARLEQEARELTAIGNDFMIRHSEVEKVPINTSPQVDYLFHRMFAMISLLVKAEND